MRADLHTHSRYSDGLLTTEELFIRAKKNNVDVIAITDHDIVQGVSDNILYAKRVGIEYIVGIELSTVEKKKPVHVLGYFTDESYKSDELNEYYRDIKRKREIRARKIISNLKEYHDINIDYNTVLGLSRGIIARPHIAKAINMSYPKYKHNYIFENFIGNECKAYVPSCELSVQDGIDLLRRNNCLVVLAHPVLLNSVIKETVLRYDFDGIEAIYFLNKENDESNYRSLAKNRNMFFTAGSDFHGIVDDTKHGDIGDVVLSGEDLSVFTNRLKEKNDAILTK